MAYIYLQQNKLAEALALYRFLYTVFPKDPIIALSFSYCLFAEDQHEESLAVLEVADALKLNQQQQVIYYLVKSKVLWHLGKLQDSRVALKKYLFNRPSNELGIKTTDKIS
jgi:tetratricopeptide (TPR) repeat protein